MSWHFSAAGHCCARPPLAAPSHLTGLFQSIHNLRRQHVVLLRLQISSFRPYPVFPPRRHPVCVLIRFCFCSSCASACLAASATSFFHISDCGAAARLQTGRLTAERGWRLLFLVATATRHSNVACASASISAEILTTDPEWHSSPPACLQCPYVFRYGSAHRLSWRFSSTPAARGGGNLPASRHAISLDAGSAVISEGFSDF